MPNPENLNKRKSFTKNDPRINKKGRPPKLPDLNILMAKVLGQEKNNITAAEQILNALRVKANKGDIRAAEVLLNRGYGLPKQGLEISGVLTVQWNEEKTYEAKPEADASPGPVAG